MNGNRLVNGERCKDNHPRRCYSFCNFGTKQIIGCQKGNSCPEFHPKLCRNSLRSSACYNDNCKFVHLKSTKRERNESETPDHRHQSHQREHQPLKGRENLRRSRPTAPAQQHQHQTRFDSSMSQQLRTEVPPTQYQNNSSDMYFLVRMIQDMNSDFQKDLTQLKESVYQQNIRWNPPPDPPTAPPLTHHLAQTNNYLELQIPYIPPQQGQTMPLWSRNIPQFFS